MSQQLALYQSSARRAGNRTARLASNPRAHLCAACREKEARYGFRLHHGEAPTERTRTLCFECFRAEIDRRQAVAARAAGGWNARQVDLPLSETLRQLDLRRRRAQIAARRALGVG